MKKRKTKQQDKLSAMAFSMTSRLREQLSDLDSKLADLKKERRTLAKVIKVLSTVK